MWLFTIKSFLCSFMSKMTDFSQRRARAELERRGFKFDSNGNIVSHGANIL